MNEEKTNDFTFTSFTWHEVSKKVKLFYPVEDYIKENFKLCDYTISTKLKSINFAFLINTPETESIFKYPNRYGWKTGNIFIYGKVPYQDFKNEDEKEALKTLCNYFLAAILTIPTLKGMKNIPFDAQKLHDDLHHLFLEKFWI